MSFQFLRIFSWEIVRNVRRHRLLALLNVLSVALGIAVYLAIQIANQSANRAFASSVDLVAGKAQLEVRGPVDETLWPILRNQAGVRSVTGIVEGLATMPDFPGDYLHIMGVDVFSGELFRVVDLSQNGKSLDLDRWMGERNTIALPEASAKRLKLKVGDSFRVLVNSEIQTLRLTSLLQANDSLGANQLHLAIMDIGWAQELFHSQGKLTALQMLLDQPDEAEKIAQQLTKILPSNLRAEAPQQRSFQLQKMVSAFQLNLTALSMVSILVGVFLIYNTIAASVARRRTQIGILRSIGVTRWEVRWLFLGEAVLFGLFGILLGTVTGSILAHSLVRAVSRTISSLYVLVSIEHASLHPAELVGAIVFGLVAVLVGAWIPANEAANLDPVAAIGMGPRAEQRPRPLRGWSWSGVAALVVAFGCGWMALFKGVRSLAFLSAFWVLVGFSLFSPNLTWLCGHLAGGWKSAPIAWRLAAGNLWRAVHRNAITVAALAAAIAMMVGLIVMIFSFRQSLNAWIDHGIAADLFVAPASNEVIGRQAFVSPAAIEWLRSQPEVESVDTIREERTLMRIDQRAAEPIDLVVIHGHYRNNLRFIGGHDQEKMARVFQGEAVAVTESFARRWHVADGSKLMIFSPTGPLQVEVAGVYSDFSRDQGAVLMSGAQFDRSWNESGVHSLAVFLRKPDSAAKVRESFLMAMSQAGEFSVYSNRELRDRIVAIFDQTFAVTYVLRTVAILVAITGIFLSVTTLVAERQRDTGVLRALGASMGQVQAFFMVEAGMIGGLASAIGVASGCVLAMVLTWVVNPAFFGWTIHLDFPWKSLFVTPLWIIPAAVLAAWYPAKRGAETLIATAVREE